MKKFLFALVICTFNIVQSVHADNYYGEDSLIYNPYDMVENKCCVVGGVYGKYLVIPNEVRIKNRSFEVTYVDERAFLGGTRLHYVFIGDNITRIKKWSFCRTLSLGHYLNSIEQVVIGSQCSYIGEYAFSDSNIKILVLRASNPPTLVTSAIGSELPFNRWTKENGIVYVPDNAITKYKRDGQWSKFWNIKGLSELSQNNDYMTLDKIKAEIEAEAARDKERADSLAATQAELEANREKLEPSIKGSINFVPLAGAVIKASNKSKLAKASETSSGHYDLAFEKGETISDVDFSKTVSGKWTDGVEVRYQCQYDPIKNVALVLVSRTLVSKNMSGQETKSEERRMFLIDRDETHKIDKKLQKELMAKFFHD